MKFSYLLDPGFLGLLAILTPIFIYSSSWYKTMGRPFRVLLAAVRFSILSAVAQQLFLTRGENGNAVYHVYFPVVYSLHAWIYSLILTDLRLKRAVRVSIIIVPVLSIANSLLLEPWNEVPTNIMLLSGTLMLGNAAFYARQRPKQPAFHPVLRSLTWYNAGNLFFYSILLVTGGLYTYYSLHHADTHSLAVVLYSSGIIYYLILGMGFYIEKGTGATFSRIERPRYRDKELLKSKVEIYEKKLRQISGQLHDEIGQKLSVLNITVNECQKDVQNSYMEDVKVLVYDTIRDLDIIQKIATSDYLAKAGLEDAIEHELELLQKNGYYEVSFKVGGEFRGLDEYKAVLLFRVVQEAISNSERHARGNRITVEMLSSTNYVFIKVRDNGKGFDADKLSQSQHEGIRSMYRRVRMIGGSIRILSTADEGTNVEIYCPTT